MAARRAIHRLSRRPDLMIIESYQKLPVVYSCGPGEKSAVKSQRPLSTAKRPVNLDLSSIQFPLPALVSISHRVSGILLFIGLIFLMWAFQVSLSSPAGFDAVREAMAHGFFARLVLWGLLSALGFHFVAGVRHLIMDMGHGETLEGGQRGAQLTIIISALLVVMAGVWVW